MLILSINNTNNTLQINNYFTNNTTTNYQIKQIKFTNKTT
ncbi:calcium-binding protein [Pandoraea pneumonica]